MVTGVFSFAEEHPRMWKIFSVSNTFLTGLCVFPVFRLFILGIFRADADGFRQFFFSLDVNMAVDIRRGLDVRVAGTLHCMCDS